MKINLRNVFDGIFVVCVIAFGIGLWLQQDVTTKELNGLRRVVPILIYQQKVVTKNVRTILQEFGERVIHLESDRPPVPEWVFTPVEMRPKGG